EKARQEEARLRDEYDSADGSAELWEIRQKQNAIATTIQRLEKSLAAQKAELAPLKQALYTATEQERREKQAEDDRRFVESTTADIYAEFRQLMQSQERFGALMEALRRRSPHDWQKIRQDLD